MTNDIANPSKPNMVAFIEKLDQRLETEGGFTRDQRHLILQIMTTTQVETEPVVNAEPTKRPKPR